MIQKYIRVLWPLPQFKISCALVPKLHAVCIIHSCPEDSNNLDEHGQIKQVAAINL